MRYLIISLLFIGILLPAAAADRPDYEFPDQVFEDLPEYPDDLIEIRDLFIENKINITHIPPEYYLQPEFYTSWEGVCNRLYDEDRKYHGIYGFNIYPSLYTVNTEKDQEFAITAFLNSNFGIGVKTGIGIEIIYDHECLSVDLVEPTLPYVLLDETYPKFTNDWSKPLILNIRILKNQNTTIQVFNTKPPEEINEQWKNKYGYDYATTEKFSMDIPQLTIEIITPGENIQPNPTPEKTSILLLFVFIIILIISFILLVFGVRRSCAKRKSSSQ